jgi:hypothetical protein
MSFKGAGDDFIKAFHLMTNIEASRQMDVLVEANKRLTEAQKTVTQKTQDLIDKSIELSENYSDSIFSLEAFAPALSAAKEALVSLIMQLEGVKASTSALFSGTAQTIRESLMSTEELYAARQRQFDELALAASNTVDPVELAQLSQAANEILLSAFNMLDETQRPEMAGGFLTALDMLEAVVAQQADMGIEAARVQTVELDAKVTEDMTAAASTQMEAAQLMWETAQYQQQIMQQWSSYGMGGGYMSNEIGL